MKIIVNTSLKIILTGFLLSNFGFAQDFVQRFNVNEILSSQSNLNLVLDRVVKNAFKLNSVDLVLVRFNGNVNNLKYIWIKKANELSLVEIDPFEGFEEYKGDYKYIIGDLGKKQSSLNVWGKLDDQSLMMKSISCSLSESNQEKNLIDNMKYLGDEKQLYVFVKKRNKLYGGKIINPKVDTETYRLINNVDSFLKK